MITKFHFFTLITVLFCLIVIFAVTVTSSVSLGESDVTIESNEKSDRSNYASESIDDISDLLDLSIEDVSVGSEEILHNSDVLVNTDPDVESETYLENDLANDLENDVKHGWVINEYGYTYVFKDAGYEQFNYKTSALDRYVSSLNAFSEKLPYNIRLFNVIVPVSSTFVDIPKNIYVGDNFFNQSQSAFCSTVATMSNGRVISVPLVEVLENRYDAGDYVYFRTDKNWTSLGAYIAYREFCEAAEFNAYSEDTFKKIDIGEYLGSFYNATRSSQMQDNPDRFFLMPMCESVKSTMTVYSDGRIYTNYLFCNNSYNINSAYNVFLGREAERYEIHTNAGGGSLLIIGDSSVNAFLPFVASHYSRIDYINPNLMKTSLEDFIKGRNYDDCILMCYSTNAISGEYIPLLNIFTGANNE